MDTVLPPLVVPIVPDQSRKIDFHKGFPGLPVVDDLGFLKADEALSDGVFVI